MLVSSRSTSLDYRYTVSAINAGGTNSVASAVFPQPRYAIIDLGTSGTPYAINNAGMVASAVSPKVASIWTNGVSVTCPTNFYANGSGGISTNGQIVGYVIQNASHYGDTNGVPAYTNTVDAPAVWSPESGVVPATTDDGAFLGTYNYASLIVPMPPAHAELFYNGTAISPSGMAAGTANVDYLDYGGYQYPLIVWDAYSAPFSYSPAAASAVGTTPSSFVPVAVNDSQEMVGNEDTGAHGYMTVADGTFVALELHPYDINNAHLAVGSDTDTGGGEVYNLATSETTPLGSYRAIKINNASPAQILDNGNQLWNYDSTNSLYRPVSIPDYLPDSPWSSPSFTALNDNGAIVGTASLTTTAGTTTHGIMLIPASFQLRDVNNVSQGWDGPSSSSDGNAWTMVPAPTGSTTHINSLVKLVLPPHDQDLGLECVVDDTDSGYSAGCISIPAITLSGTEANIDITGLAATATTPKDDPFHHLYTTVSPKPAHVVLRQKSDKRVLLTLNVVVLTAQTAAVDIDYIDDSANTSSIISTTTPSGTTIIDSLNETYQKQANITFSVRATHHITATGDFNSNGELEYEGSSHTYLIYQPKIGDALSKAIYQVPEGTIAICIVKHLRDLNGGGAVGITQGQVCLVNADASMVVFAHEVGHALGLSSQFQGQANAHDLGPWPIEFKTIGYLNPYGLMYPSESGTYWIRSGDWSQANDQAYKIKN